MKRVLHFLKAALRLLRMLPRKMVFFIFLQVFTCGCVFAFSDIVEPSLYAILFSNLQDGATGHFMQSCAIGAWIVLVMFLIQYLNDVVLDARLFHSINALNIQAFDRFHRLPYDQTRMLDEGDVFNRIHNGSDQAASVWISIIMLISEVLSLALLLGMCVRISLPLAGIAVGLSVTAFARIKIRSRQADEYSQKNEHIKGRLESCRYSAVYDMECAVINGVQDQVLDAYRKQREAYWQEKLRDVRREGLTNAVMETLGHGFRCAAPAALLGGGAVTYSAATSALSVLDPLTESIHSLSLDTEGIVKAFAPIERLTDLLMSGAQGQDQADGMNIHKPAIRVDRLSVSFAGRPCLCSVTMEIPFGQKVALIGKNGSGKSTLLRAILGTIKPEEGCVQINHANALLLSHDAKRAIFSYAPASAQVFSENVSDNIAMGADASETGRVSDAARTASVEEALLSARGDALSGGQAQRVNLARAFVHASPILILDEPTSSISAGQGEEILRKALAGPTTALVTTHDPASLALFDRVILLENGAVAFDGGCVELIKTRQYREWKGELDESLKGEKADADS